VTPLPLPPKWTSSVGVCATDPPDLSRPGPSRNTRLPAPSSESPEPVSTIPHAPPRLRDVSAWIEAAHCSHPSSVTLEHHLDVEWR
jgi:hypothetical protein